MPVDIRHGLSHCGCSNRIFAMTPSKNISRLIEIMEALRTPVTGCPWDLEQDFASIAPYTIEEAYEVADAIASGDRKALCDELGDLLLQVAYHARMAEEEGAFAFGDVVEAVTAKMIRRHPHVFGDAPARAAGAPKGFWERIKAEEKQGQPKAGYLDGVPLALPALTRAKKLQEKAARAGFDWKDSGPVLDKVEEEITELRAAIASGSKPEMEGEFGDVLFSLVNLGRHLELDAETSLRQTNDKFRNRFHFVEARLEDQGRTPGEASLEEMEALWQQAKAFDR